MTEKMKTVCVGRYLVDVPAQAEVVLSHERIAGFAVETVEESEDAFRERVAAREAAVSTRGLANDGTGGMVEARDLRIPGMIGRTLIYGRNRGYLMEGDRRVEDEYVSVEALAHIGDISISLLAEYADEARAQLAEALLARLRLRGENEVPSAPGFCIWRAVFVEPLPVRKAEHAVMHLGLPGHPDLALTLVSMPGRRFEPDLLARAAQTDASMGPDALVRMSKLREGKRNINGIKGEELVVRAREYNFTTSYGLNWESPGVEDNSLQPYLLLELQTGLSERTGGKPVETSLHEDALLSLWDSISSTIRLRQNDSPQPPSPPSEPPGPKLGAVASAGEICPQSGWWQCNAGGLGLDVHGGQTQYLHKDDRMPQALLLPRQTLWQKVRGIQPSIESDKPTVWKLVDKRQRPRTPAGVPLAQPGAPSDSVELAVNGGRAVTPGTYVRTGDPCPASGWWRCDDPHALDGTRWFASGSLLPVATFQVPTGVFTRPGGPEFIHRRSGWQLVRQAEAPVPAPTTVPLPDGLPADEPPAMA
ncbi:MAG: T6SS immunity protein Tli4 family protein [Terriglobales bacterium]